MRREAHQHSCSSTHLCLQEIDDLASGKLFGKLICGLQVVRPQLGEENGGAQCDDRSCSTSQPWDSNRITKSDRGEAARTTSSLVSVLLRKSVTFSLRQRGSELQPGKGYRAEIGLSSFCCPPTLPLTLLTPKPCEILRTQVGGAVRWVPCTPAPTQTPFHRPRHASCPFPTSLTVILHVLEGMAHPGLDPVPAEVGRLLFFCHGWQAVRLSGSRAHHQGRCSRQRSAGAGVGAGAVGDPAVMIPRY